MPSILTRKSKHVSRRSHQNPFCRTEMCLFLISTEKCITFATLGRRTPHLASESASKFTTPYTQRRFAGSDGRARWATQPTISRRAAFFARPFIPELSRGDSGHFLYWRIHTSLNVLRRSLAGTTLSTWPYSGWRSYAYPSKRGLGVGQRRSTWRIILHFLRRLSTIILFILELFISGSASLTIGFKGTLSSTRLFLSVSSHSSTFLSRRATESTGRRWH